MTIGERLKILRERKGLTLEQVGKYIGVSKPTVYKYESGAVINIPPDKIDSLAKLYNVSKPYLCGWTDEPDNRMDIQAPAIPVPNGEAFVKAYEYMSYDDRIQLTDIFNRAYIKMMEDGKNSEK